MNAHVPQGTEAWHLERLGKVTASRMGDVVNKLKDGKRYTAGREKYLYELLAARLTGVPAPVITSRAIRHGQALEDDARRTYEFTTGDEVLTSGFVDHPTIPGFGSSPDGLVGQEGGLEIKAPDTTTHLKTLGGEPIDPDYVLQCHTNMIVTGRAWWDFVSFDDRLPPNLQIFIKRIPRDEAVVAFILGEVRGFLTELNAMERKLRAYDPSQG